jgi:uncharacterized protein YkwD
MVVMIRSFTAESTEDTETQGQEMVLGSGIRTSCFSAPAAPSVLSVVNIFLALVSMGCAGAARSASTVPPGIAAAAPVVAGVPSGAAAEFYATDGIASVTTDPFADRLAAELDESRKRQRKPPLLRDGRLDRVASDLAFATGSVRTPPPEAVAFLLTHYGLVEPEPNLFLVHGDVGAEASAAAGLRAQFASAAASTWRRVGIGVRRDAGKWNAVLVFQEKNFDLDPMPRRLVSGGRVDIAGRIRTMFHSPEVLFTSPRGDVERLATSVKLDTFVAHFACTRGDGSYQVEIGASDARGPRVLANFPVYCGSAPPATFTAWEPADGHSIDPVQAEAQLLAQLDRDRKGSGLPALVHDPRLAQIARQYSREMAETGEVAHYSRRTGSVVDRIVAAKILPAPTLIAENVGSAMSASDAESGFMASPGHRDNILNRAVTHVGVGVAVGREEAGSAPLFFTQVFAGWGQ